MKRKTNAMQHCILLLAIIIAFSSLTSSFAIGVSEEEYISELKQLRDNIYHRYKTSANSQWEWANIGFYEGINNGIKGGYRKTIEDLPEGLDLYGTIGGLDSRSIAGMGGTVAGTVIALTAMGIDASNLKPFEIDDKPFRTRDGKDATNLVKFIYDSNPGGINFCTWGLIALDMGNYSTPYDANSTREKLLEKILNHEYGSDGFAVDMVAMLMQSIYPYRNDPIYGERVKDKLEHGLDLFQGHKTANKVEPMGEDFIFNSWGVPNSESTAHVIIALCNMGIDPFTDYRFSRGTNDNMIFNWVNRFTTNDHDGFGHTDNRYNGIGTEQGMYALQCYINFIENGGKKPYSLWYDGVPFNFGRSDTAEEPIISFELLGQKGEISHKTNTITIIMENPVSIQKLKNVKPKIELGSDYTLNENMEGTMDFTKDEVTYTIKHKDGTTIDYTINIVNGNSWFNKFMLRGVEGKIDKLENEVKIVLPFGVYTDNIKPNIAVIQSVDKNVKVQPDINLPIDFSKKEGTKFILSSEEGNKKVEYTILTEYTEAKGYSKIKEFSIGEHKAEIDGHSIVFTLPKGVSKEEFIEENKNKTPVIKGKYYESIDPNPNHTGNLKNSLDDYLKDYVLVDEDGKVNLYNVKFVEDKPSIKPPSKDPKEDKKSNKEKQLNIESFKIGTQEGQIDNINGRIFIELPYELDLTNVTPIITISRGYIYPASGRSIDLNRPVIFILRDGDEIKKYNLIVIISEPKPATKLWQYIEQYSDLEDYQVIIGGED